MGLPALVVLGCAEGAETGGPGGSSGLGGSAAGPTVGSGAATSSSSASSTSSTGGSPVGSGAASSSSSGSAGSGGTGGSAGSGGMGGVGATGGTGGGPTCPECVDEIDPAVRCSGDVVVAPLAMPAGTVWATSVVAFSSEYQTPSWGSIQVQGPPDTYPSYGDLMTAWATLSQDSTLEFITVGFTPPVTGSQVWILETYNPDAVAKVTITTALGDTIVYDVTPFSVGECAYVLGVPTMTTDPITQVRIDLSSDIVFGWNEIDAIGIVP
jgi:hypothetical protein